MPEAPPAESRSNTQTIARNSYWYGIEMAFSFVVAMGTSVAMARAIGPYGAQYAPAAPVLAIAALFAIPKALYPLAPLLLQIVERQKFLVVWGCTAGVVNIALDALLIPRHQAMGAALANGIAQTVSALGVWALAIWITRIRLPFASLFRIAGSTAVMALVAWLVARPLSPAAAAVTAPLAGAVVYLAMLRISGALQPNDRYRLAKFGAKVPARYRAFSEGALGLLLPAPAASGTSA